MYYQCIKWMSGVSFYSLIRVLTSKYMYVNQFVLFFCAISRRAPIDCLVTVVYMTLIKSSVDSLCEIVVLCYVG